MSDINIRQAEPSDYPFIASVVNEWWGGRNLADMLPKLFFVHFRQTGFVAIQGGNIVGFLDGFVSQTFSNEAYIHFAGVHPAFRKNGIGHAIYKNSVNSRQDGQVLRRLVSPVRHLFGLWVQLGLNRFFYVGTSLQGID